jgi:hypothetical protein
MKKIFHCLRRIGAAIFLVVAFCKTQLLAQTNSATTNAPLKLLPPLDEMPPTFWEQNAAVILFATIGVAALLAFFLWLAVRPKPKIMVSPEIQARAVLHQLSAQPEDGAMLSRVSQVVRNYFSAAFQCSPGELTTTEFCREISGNEKIGAELSAATANFLREADTRKFSQSASSEILDAANQALNLVAQAEQRRAQLREISETQINQPRA